MEQLQENHYHALVSEFLSENWPQSFEGNIPEAHQAREYIAGQITAQVIGDLKPEELLLDDPPQEDVPRDDAPPTNVAREDAHEDVVDSNETTDDIFSAIQPLNRHLESKPRNLKTDYEMETARNTELHMLHAVQFELTHGDTVVYVDLPNNSRSPRKLADCSCIAFRSQMFRVHSTKLLQTGSPKFAQMLGPTYQHRVQRRRKIVNNLPAGIKYVLDLTPPSEGDDLVFQMMELSLTPGIINWWTSGMLHDGDLSLVLGHDDVCTCKRQPPGIRRPDPDPAANASNSATGEGGGGSSQEQESQPQSPSQKRNRDGQKKEMAKDDSIVDGFLETGELKVSMPPKPQELLRIKKEKNPPEVYHVPEFRQVPDYCPVRHCAGIVRLLMLIEGHNIVFDSAIRVWTMVALAKIFDCTDTVRDQVTQWILHGRNSRFIEVLPEESLRIGYTLKICAVTQSAFRILVNELALHEADDSEHQHKYLRTTIFGRRIEDCIDDELSNMIQHAARALNERISVLVGQFQNPCFFDDMDIKEWKQLRRVELLLLQEDGWKDALHHAQALHKLQRVMKALIHGISWQFTRAADRDFSTSASSYASMDADRATYVLPQNFEEINVIIRRMTHKQRFLCPFIYTTLSSHFQRSIFFGQSSRHEESRHIPFRTLLLEAEDALQQVVVENPQRTSVKEWDVAFNQGPDLHKRPLYRVVSLTDLVALDMETDVALRPVLHSWIRHYVEPPLNITRHLLLTLSHNEMKFLPLWAGGYNDGTGGVFETPVPLADMGPNGPGPSYHTGMSIDSANSSTTGSLVDGVLGMNVRGSTVVGSVDVQDSISTVYHPDHVIPDDVSIATESFTLDGSEYEHARFADPADHQAMGLVVDSLVESASDHGFMGYDDSDQETENGWSVKSEIEDAVMVG